MAGQNINKLNHLFHIWPDRTVALQSWLTKQGIYRQLSNAYCKSGWLAKIGHGAFVRRGAEVDWTGALYALQEQMKLKVHVGGKTALQRRSLAHFLPMGEPGIVWLLGESSKLPKWFMDNDWGASIHYAMLNLFVDDFDIGITKEEIGEYHIVISSPERAILELLHFVPQMETLVSAKLLMEGLTTLRPQLVQELLEKCRSVKVKRLFMFLAEESGHEWVDLLDKTKINFGKGIRSIIKNGRLDPIYNITVPDKPFNNRQRLEQAFRNKKGKSVAVRLMCPDESTQLIFDKEDYYYTAVSLMASEEDKGEMLSRLDYLLNEFKIEKRGSKGFKGKLKENWLDCVRKGNVQDINKASPVSALIELVVADYLKGQGSKIIDLSAWHEDREVGVPDIRYRDSRRIWNAEIKYIGTDPEISARINKQIETGVSSAGGIDERTFVNYYFGRIAQAAEQLKDHPLESRQVWIVFENMASCWRDIFERNYLIGPDCWYANGDKQRNVLAMFGEGIIKNQPSYWLGEISELVLATKSEWSLKAVHHFKTKDLVI